jgi:hypothetical protein
MGSVILGKDKIEMGGTDDAYKKLFLGLIIF